MDVYPAEVEAVLNQHPAVVQSAVIGRTVPGNEEVVAYVELLPGSAATPTDLMEYRVHWRPTSALPRSSCWMRCRPARPAKF